MKNNAPLTVSNNGCRDTTEYIRLLRQNANQQSKPMPLRIVIENENHLTTIINELSEMGFDVPPALKTGIVPKCVLFWENDCRVTFSTRMTFKWLKESTLADIKPYRKKRRKYKCDQPVQKIDPKTGQTVCEYINVMDAATDMCVAPFNIYKAARGDLKTAFGYIWKYKTESK